MKDEEIVWEEPPTDTHHKGVWKELLGPLVDHPQKWARVRVYTVNKSAYAAAQAI